MRNSLHSPSQPKTPIKDTSAVDTITNLGSENKIEEDKISEKNEESDDQEMKEEAELISREIEGGDR